MKASAAIKVLQNVQPDTEVELDIKIIRGRRLGLIFSPTSEQLFILMTGIVLIVFGIGSVVDSYYKHSSKINYIAEETCKL